MQASPKLPDLSSTVAIVGAGFSKEAKLPTADDLSKHFLAFTGSAATPIQNFISESLRTYWRDVFGYEDGGVEPTFEDHFTLLDLAANSGHNIGHRYTPAMLRALRRISIHRVFEIIDKAFEFSPPIVTFLAAMLKGQGSIVSLNWDIVVEKHLRDMGALYKYDFAGHFLDGSTPPESAFPLVKLHGSANWHYCDACHTTQFGDSTKGKTTLHLNTFLEANDVAVLGGDARITKIIASEIKPIECGHCHNPKTTARVATFSYAKAFDFFPFHASWDAALRRLSAAKRWIFIGYSLPEADFAFKHLLKTAQFASLGKKEIVVVTRSATIPDSVDKRANTALGRYEKMFGFHSFYVGLGGFDKWVKECIA